MRTCNQNLLGKTVKMLARLEELSRSAQQHETSGENPSAVTRLNANVTEKEAVIHWLRHGHAALQMSLLNC